MNEIKRGEIYYADLNPVVGSEQMGLRPVLVLQNDIGNIYSPTTILRPAEYAEQSGAINSRVNALRTERRQLLREQDENSALSRLRRLNDLLIGMEKPIIAFDEELFTYMVEEIFVPADTSLSRNIYSYSCLSFFVLFAVFKILTVLYFFEFTIFLIFLLC